MDGFARDKDVVRLIVDTFRAMPELPSLAMRDYKPYMSLIACSPEDFAYCYLSNDLVAVYETEYRTTELLFFCDLLRCMRGRSYLNCVTNRVCDYFFRARRDTLRHIDTPLREIDMQYAESRLKELEEAVFRWKVRIYKWRTFTADELAEMCGMSYSHFQAAVSRNITAVPPLTATAGAHQPYQGRYVLPTGARHKGGGGTQLFPVRQQFFRFLQPTDIEKTGRAETGGL